MKDWRRRFFRSAVFSPGQPEALAKAPAEARFLWRALGLRPGSKVLDLACGTGRHAVALARRGALVVGVDATPEYVRIARRGRHPRCRFIQGDMRRLPFENQFDAAINLWTSFGYFPDPHDDLRALMGVRRALRPRGLLLIDVMNADWLRRNFQPKRWSRRGDGSYLLEESRLLKGRDERIESEWTVLRRREAPARARLMVRQYDLARLSALLRKAGLEPVKAWGGFDGRRLGPKADRLIVLARSL